jgi:trk system potassium uptake protein TrkA
MKVIVAGAGEVGFNIAEKLSKDKIDVVLIDNDPIRLTQVVDVLDVQTIVGNASHPAVLHQAGISNADLFVAVTSNDESNILSCRLCQLLAPDVRRAARIRDQVLYQSLTDLNIFEELGLSKVIDPTSLIVDTILDYLDLPGAVDVIDVASGRLKFVGMRLPRHHSAVGQTLAQVLPRNEGSTLLVVAIYRQHEVLIPTGATILKARDLLYFAVTTEHLDNLGDFFDMKWRTAENIFIMGGGEVGLALAKRLEERSNLSIKLIEHNAERCEFLSGELTKTIVLRGDGTDQSLLEDEGISECHVFISVGTDDEKNMVTCLLAKRLGALNTITRVNRYSYAPLVSAIGLDSLVSARVAAVSAMLKYIHKGRVITVATLQNEEAEVMEVVLSENSKLVGQPIFKSKFPDNCIVAAVLREDSVIIPRGDTILQSSDTLAVVARAEAVHLLEKAFG